MGRHRSFGSGKNISDFEPMSFDLAGQTFNCRPAVPGSVLLNFIQSVDENEGGNSASALYGFLQNSMTEDEYEKLKRTLDDPEVIIDIEEIANIVSWLMEEYGERPTQQSGGSGNGQ